MATDVRLDPSGFREFPVPGAVGMRRGGPPSVVVNPTRPNPTRANPTRPRRTSWRALALLAVLVSVGPLGPGVAPAAGATAPQPLVTPVAPVTDFVEGGTAGTPAPGTTAAPRSGDMQGSGEVTPATRAPVIRDQRAPERTRGAGTAGAWSGDGMVLVALSVLAAALAALGGYERLGGPRVPAGRQLSLGGRPGRLRVGGDVHVPDGTSLPGVPGDGVAVLPVLTVPASHPASWRDLHAVVDAWAWHEYWLVAGRSSGSVLPADGLVVGYALAVDDAAVTWGSGLVVPAAGGAVTIEPTSGGAILTRTGTGLTPWLEREATAMRLAARHRLRAAATVVHALSGLPLAVGLPLAALALAQPVPVVVLALLPVVVGLMTAIRRWVVLDDVDGATTMRLPIARGWLLVLTGPVHAALRWRAAWTAIGRPTPPQLVRVVGGGAGVPRTRPVTSAFSRGHA